MLQVSAQNLLNVVVGGRDPIPRAFVEIETPLAVLWVIFLTIEVLRRVGGDVEERGVGGVVLQTITGIKGVMIRTLRMVLLRGALHLYLQMHRYSNRPHHHLEVGVEVGEEHTSVKGPGVRYFCRLLMYR
jgi:hypothetical protein